MGGLEGQPVPLLRSDSRCHGYCQVEAVRMAGSQLLISEMLALSLAAEDRDLSLSTLQRHTLSPFLPPHRGLNLCSWPILFKIEFNNSGLAWEPKGYAECCVSCHRGGVPNKAALERRSAIDLVYRIAHCRLYPVS
jgi:hypothetical protein